MGRQPPRESRVVLVWGCNEHAALGLPASQSADVPQRILALRSSFVRAAAVSDGRSRVSTSGSQLFGWGRELGGLPAQIPGPDDVSELVCTATHAFALTDAGEVFSCSYNGDVIERLPFSIEVARIACGEKHCMALDEGGGVLTWGCGADGQLGHAGAAEFVKEPTHVSGLRHPIVALGCGQAHSVLLSTNGDVYGCGRRECLCGAHAAASGIQPAMTLLDSAAADSEEMMSVACGRSHTLLLTRSGRVFSFGRGDAGQLGHGSSAGVGRALRVGGTLAARQVTAIWGSGHDQSFARSSDGCVFFWGAPTLTGAETASVPTELKALHGLELASISACATHALALTCGGDLYSWGGCGDDAAALGLQRLGSVSVPMLHPLLSKLKVAQLSCGDGPHTLALTAADAGGVVYAWGRNTKGELGHAGAGGGAPRIVDDGALRGRRTPLRQVAAGGHFSLVCGPRADGGVGDELIGWGAAAEGQLGSLDFVSGGEATSDVQWCPAQLTHLVNSCARVISLQAGWQHAGVVLLESAGDAAQVSHTVVGVPVLWGSSAGGALGVVDGSPTSRPRVPTGSLQDVAVRLLACGRETSAAVDYAGQLHVWGRLLSQPAPEPQRMRLPSTLPVTQLCCSARRLLVLCAPHSSDAGRAGLQATGEVAVFECVKGRLHQISGLEGRGVEALAGDSDHLLALTADRSILRKPLAGGSQLAAPLPLPNGMVPQALVVSRTHGALLARASSHWPDSAAASDAPLSSSRTGSARPCWLQPLSDEVRPDPSGMKPSGVSSGVMRQT